MPDNVLDVDPGSKFWSGLDLRLAQRRHFLDTVNDQPIWTLCSGDNDNLHDHDAGPLRQGGFKAELECEDRRPESRVAKIDDPFTKSGI